MGQAEGEIKDDSEVESLVNWVDGDSTYGIKEVRKSSWFGESLYYKLELKMPVGCTGGNAEQANAKMELGLKRGLRASVKDVENG